jgi:hypothetical protein
MRGRRPLARIVQTLILVLSSAQAARPARIGALP